MVKNKLLINKVFYYVQYMFLIVTIMLMGASAFASNSVKIGMRLEPPHLDPTSGASASIDYIVYNNVFEGLLGLDETGAVYPLLAKKWTVSDDLKTYTFHLRKNVKFHNGELFNSKTVEFSFNRILKEGSVNSRASLYQNIKLVQSIGEHTVQFTLKSPSSDFLYTLALPDAVIVGKTSYHQNKNNPIGTGPFKFEKLKKGYYVQLEKYGSYYGVPAKLNTVQFRFYSDNGSATASILSGGLDAFPRYTDMLSIPAIKAMKNFTVVLGSTEGETLIALNNAHPKLKDVRVRRALQYAINKDEIITVVLQGLGNKIGSHFPPHHKAYVELSNAYPYNVEKAKKMLKNAGADNLALEFTVPPTHDVLSEIVSAQLRKVGVLVTIKKVDWATWLSTTFKAKKYDITVVTHAEPNDYEIYGNKEYYFSYDSAKVRTMLKEIKEAKNVNIKTQLLQDLQRKLNEDSVNIWLYQRPKIGVWNKNLIGLWKNAPVEGTPLRNVYWNK